MAGRTPSSVMMFAAGLGLRMLPLTRTLPKPMIRIAGKPMIDHMLDRFAAAGVRRAVVNVHHLADQIEEHLSARGDIEIRISDERAALLDQGGGIARALPLLGENPFFICNTDALWLEGPRQNLARLAAAFDPAKMDILLLVAATATSVGVDWAGDFFMGADGRLSRRPEREIAPFVYAGVGIVKPELFAREAREIFPLAPFFWRAAQVGRLFGLRLDGVWLHVGSPPMIEEAERTIRRSVL